MVAKHTRAYTVRPVRDPSLYRRKLAYPIITLCAAGVIYFYSRGQIGTTAPAVQGDYESFAREVMVEVRGGRPIPKAVDPAIEQVFAAMAPASVRAGSAGGLSYEFTGPTDPGAGLPHIQSVVVRGEDGEGVSLAISILGGRPEVVGVARVAPLPRQSGGAVSDADGAASDADGAASDADGEERAP